MPPFDRSKFPPISDEERRLLLEGNKVHAILSYRNRHMKEGENPVSTYGLFDSKEVIDYEWKAMAASRESFPKAVEARVELLLSSLSREFELERGEVMGEISRVLLLERNLVFLKTLPTAPGPTK